jgi:alkylated DNA repair dioxygenase AlkB
MQLTLFGTQDLISTNQSVGNANVISDLLKITGLTYRPDFLSNDEHSKLWNIIRQQSWLGDIKRRVQHYGWKYDYKARSIDYSMYLGELPYWAKEIALRLKSEGYMPEVPDQLIVNEYQPGQGIANHIDCEPCFGNTIISISLGAPIVMDFIQKRSREKIDVLLEPRSLTVVQDESRYQWTHGIAARKTDQFHGRKFERQLRISLTFRKVILNSCEIPNS